MPRIRTIKPEFFADEKLSKLKHEIRLLYIGLWVFSDDYGTVRSNPIWIKSNIFPYDEQLRVNDVRTWLDALVTSRMLEPFDYNGEGFYNIRTFNSHQRVEKPSKPIVPQGEKEKLIKTLPDYSGSPPRTLPDYSVPEVVSSNSKGSSKGEEWELQIFSDTKFFETIGIAWGINQAVFKQMVADFQTVVSVQEKQHKNYGDFKTHFFNWGAQKFMGYLNGSSGKKSTWKHRKDKDDY